MSLLLLFICATFSMVTMPFGLLPSVLFFRDLADGRSVSHRTERLYTITVWAGLAGAWIITTFAFYGLARMFIAVPGSA